MPSAVSNLISKHLGLVLVALALVAFLVYRNMAATKSLKEGEVADIRQQINTGIGATGLDIKTLVRNVTPTPGYNAQPVARTIHDAHGYINDDEDAVFSAFQNKSIYQIAALALAFQSLYGVDLDAYLHNGSYTSEFLSLAEYQQVIGMVQAARTLAHL